jgi:hypothetical protein
MSVEKMNPQQQAFQSLFRLNKAIATPQRKHDESQ